MRGTWFDVLLSGYGVSRGSVYLLVDLTRRRGPKMDESQASIKSTLARITLVPTQASVLAMSLILYFSYFLDVCKD